MITKEQWKNIDSIIEILAIEIYNGDELLNLCEKRSECFGSGIK